MSEYPKANLPLSPSNLAMMHPDRLRWDMRGLRTRLQRNQAHPVFPIGHHATWVCTAPLSKQFLCFRQATGMECAINSPPCSPRRRHRTKLIGVTGKGSWGRVLNFDDHGCHSGPQSLGSRGPMFLPLALRDSRPCIELMPGRRLRKHGSGHCARLPARRQHHGLVPTAVPHTVPGPADHEGRHLVLPLRLYCTLRTTGSEIPKADLVQGPAAYPLCARLRGVPGRGRIPWHSCTWVMRPAPSMSCR